MIEFLKINEYISRIYKVLMLKCETSSTSFGLFIINNYK